MFLYLCEVKGIVLNIVLSQLNPQVNKRLHFLGEKRQSDDRVKETDKSSIDVSRAYVSPQISTAQIRKLKELQKTVQNIFLNPNISIGEAPIMIQRYKDLEKIEDKEEYIKAVFEEAKNNFGFRNSKMRLEIYSPERMKGYWGGADTAFYNVEIRSDIPREKVLETIHHELRHHKQHYYAYNLSPEMYMKAVNKKIEILTDGKRKDNWKDINKFNEWLSSNLGEQPSKYNVPIQYIPFAEKCTKAIESYVIAHDDMNAYWNNFVEQDARNTGKQIAELCK